MRDFTIEEKRELLRNHILLQALSDAELDRLARYSRTRELEAGELIFSKGDPGDSMAVVIEGRVVIGSTSIDGKELVLNIIHSGDVLGEIAGATGLPVWSSNLVLAWHMCSLAGLDAPVLDHSGT